MIDFLILVETIVNVRLGTGCDPEYVPVVRLSVVEAMGLQSGPDQSTLTFQKLVAQFCIIP